MDGLDGLNTYEECKSRATSRSFALSSLLVSTEQDSVVAYASYLSLSTLAGLEEEMKPWPDRHGPVRLTSRQYAVCTFVTHVA